MHNQIHTSSVGYMETCYKGVENYLKDHPTTLKIMGIASSAGVLTGIATWTFFSNEPSTILLNTFWSGVVVTTAFTAPSLNLSQFISKSNIKTA